MANPLFSVITASFNRTGLLEQALKSLQAQTFKDFEAFIIDDGSSADVTPVFSKFSGQRNWKFIKLDRNRGQAFCRNTAIRQAGGKFITFLDSDDIWLPERLAGFAELAARNGRAGFIFSNGYILQDSVIVSRFFDENRKIPTGMLPPYMAISDYWLPYVTTNVAFIREAADKTGYFREDMSHLEDMELYVKILKHYEVDYIPEPLSVYRIHPVSKDPKSLTLKWEKGVEDFLKSMETASPPDDIRITLIDYVMKKQVSVFLKNGMGGKARKYAMHISHGNILRPLFIALSFVPKPVFSLLKYLNGLKRRKISAALLNSQSAAALSYVKSLER